MNLLKLAKLLEGMHTIETIAKDLNIKQTSALNIVSKLKKAGYLKTSGGGRQKRIYTIDTKKEVPGNPGMFDLINKYAKTKVRPYFKHLTYGNYTEENALIDAIKTKSFRTIKHSLHLFNHIKNWKKLHHLAKKHHLEQEVGALYDTARLYIKTRKMPENIYKSLKRKKQKKIIIRGLKPKDENIIKISREWNIQIPFRKQDLEELR